MRLDTDAPAASLLKRAMHHNRNGDWRCALELATLVAKRDRLPAEPVERCEALASAAVAAQRLGELEQATSLQRDFAKRCADIAAEHWMHREVASLTAGDAIVVVPTQLIEADDGFWSVGAPADVGLDSEAVEAHRALCEETGADAVLVVSGRTIVSEWTSARYPDIAPLTAMSSTKSVTAILTMMLLEDGHIESLDSPVSTWLPEWQDGARGEVTLRHVMSHTSGLAMPDRDEGVGFVDDKNAYVIGLEPEVAPGTRFAYSNEGVQLLSPVLDAAAGEPIQDYARRRLFQPLGMVNTSLRVDGAGHAWTYADMVTTPRDFARLGLLMIGGGTLDGVETLSSDSVETMLTPSALNLAHGLLWWLLDGSQSPRGFYTSGYLNTDMYVFPEHDLVVVRMQAPTGGTFTGARESGNYRERALPLFSAMVAPRAKPAP